MQMTTPLEEKPIFIVGVGRSGTTLLRSLLSAHSRIAITPESHFLKRAESDWGLRRGAPDDFDSFWEEYTAWSRFKDLGVDPDQCRDRILREGRPTFRTIFRALLTAYRERADKERVGEKTPGHVRYLGDLLEWFPEARIVAVERDARAVVASHLGCPWVTKRLTPVSLRRGLILGKRLHEAAKWARDWSETYEDILPSWREDPRVLLVTYQGLVQNAEGEIGRICEFLEEPYEPAMLSARTEKTAPLPLGSINSADEQRRRWLQEHHAKTFEPVSTASLEKWKNQLTPAEIAIIEGKCARAMRAAGYPFSTSTTRRAAGKALASLALALGALEEKIRSALAEAWRPVMRIARGLRRRLAARPTGG